MPILLCGGASAFPARLRSCPVPASLFPVSRFGLIVLCLCVSLIFFGRTPPAVAAAPEKADPPRFQVGDVSVAALLDRQHEMDVSLFSGPATPEEREKYMPAGKAPASINAFLLQEGGRNILVDAGFGTVMPGAPQLEQSLADFGLTPQSIDLVLLTHMHSDHIGGLLKHKKRAFPKARVMVSKPELDYWTDLAEKDPGNANAALVKTVLAEYGADILPPFTLGAALLPGVTSVDASGHTPGHSVFLVESLGRRLLILGDLLHAAALQFPLPEECARYDMDVPAAVKARKAVLSMAAEQNIPVAGMHIPFPGVGRVTAQGAGFGFAPLPYAGSR
jgi:glyoxylase-like metal-dependent hydrolase (beta-lactamase superfamily II)